MQMRMNARTRSSAAEATVTTPKARSAVSVQRDSECLRLETNVKVRCVLLSYFNTASPLASSYKPKTITLDSTSAPGGATASVSLSVAVR